MTKPLAKSSSTLNVRAARSFRQTVQKGIMKYGTLNLGQIEALVNKLGGMNGVNMILSGKADLSFNFTVWRYLDLGTFDSIPSLRTALEARDVLTRYKDGMGSEKILDRIELVSPQNVRLALLSLNDLGGALNGMQAVYEVAQKYGLDYCPDETAAQVLLQYGPVLSETSSHELHFATDPQKHGGSGFRIRAHEGKHYITRFSNRPTYQRFDGDKFIFVIRK